ncbi:MAG: indole-3-glycerol phosphate synthase TrpC [Deltaproteobacteria bacterium]|nr:indole-3-glycerol phosphate synthase TrpC [Deltaproteobacteria bacterium]
MNPSFLEKIVDHKHKEVAAARARVPESGLLKSAGEVKNRRSLAAALQPQAVPPVNIIAEIKRASPSKGVFHPGLDAGSLAAEYEAAGAAAISVLTDERFFKGSARDLMAVKKVSTLPVLRKDFLVSPYQVLEAAAWGADAVLLIARILSVQQIRDYLAMCAEFDMDALVEVHSREDLIKVQQTQAVIIGINNRDLSTFETNIQKAMELVRLLAPNQISVAASGIAGPEDIRRNVENGLTNFLVGESLVRSEDVKGHLEALLAAGETH